MKYKLIFIIIFLWPVFCQGQQQSVKILSWNIFMIPPIIYKSCQCERAELISEMMKQLNPDVIVFQEAFQKKPREIIWEDLKTVYPYSSGVGKGGFFRTHSGVWIISKYPIEKTERITYKKAKGSDKLAKKGATFVQVNINGKRIQVIGTHVQSDAKYASTRNVQFKQLTEELANKYFDPSVPQFITGDLNTDYFMVSDYNTMLSILDASNVQHEGEPFSWNGTENDLGKKFFGEHKEILDYVLIRNSHQKLAKVDHQIIYRPKVNEPACKRGFMYLSDHYPVMAEISLY